MAKKTKIHIDDDYEFNQDLDMPDFDFGNGDIKDDRHPVTKVVTSIPKGMIDGIKETQFLKKTAKTILPDGFGQSIDLANNVNDTVKRIYDDTVKEIKPAIKEFKRVAPKLIPSDSKITPKWLKDKLKKWEEDNKRQSKVISVEDQREIDISNSLGSIFKIQLEDTHRRSQENDAKDRLREGIELSRHKDMYSISNKSSVHLGKLEQYFYNVDLAHKKKSLELQFRNLFALRDIYTHSKELGSVQSEILKNIVKNTGLPDSVKIRNSENFSDVSKKKFAESLSNGLFGGRNDFIENLGKRFNSVVMSKINEYSQGMISGLQGLEYAKETVSDYDDTPGFDKSKMVGSVIGGMGAKLIGGLAAEKYKDKIINSKLGNKLNLKQLGFKAEHTIGNASGLLNEFKSRSYHFDNALKSNLFPLLQELIPELGIDKKVNITKGKNIYADASLNVKTLNSINDIIPGYLSRILRELVITRTGNVKIQLTKFDHENGKFTNSDKLTQSILNKTVNKSGAKYTKQKLDSIIDNIEEKTGPISKEERSELRRVLLRNKASGGAATINSLNRSSNYTGIKEVTSKSLKGKIEAYVNSLNDEDKVLFTRKHNNVDGYISDTRTMIQQYIDHGNLPELKKLGLVNKDGTIDINKLLDYYSNYTSTTSGNKPAKSSKVSSSNIPNNKVNINPNASTYKNTKATSNMKNRFSNINVPKIDEDKIDLYVEGSNKPRLTYIKLINGDYKDSVSDEVITKFEDIKNTIIDENNNVVLDKNDIPNLKYYDIRSKLFKKYTKIKDRIISSSLDLADKSKVIGNTFNKSIEKRLGDLSSHLNLFVSDIYVEGNPEPVLLAKKIRAGKYYLKSSKVIIRSAKDIVDAVMDENGNEVLSIEDLNKMVVYEPRAKKYLPLKSSVNVLKLLWHYQTVIAPKWTMWNFKQLGKVVKLGVNLVRGRVIIKDVYVGNEKTPRLYATKIKAGEYRLRSSGRLIKHHNDIVDAVVDSNGNVVINYEELEELRVYRNVLNWVNPFKLAKIAAKGIKDLTVYGTKKLTTAGIKLFKIGAGFASKGINKTLKFIISTTDIFIPGSARPVLTKINIDAGKYFSVKTGKLIKHQNDIDGAVIDDEGNEVLSEEQFNAGIYNVSGRLIKGNIGKKIWAGLSKVNKVFSVRTKLLNVKKLPKNVNDASKVGLTKSELIGSKQLGILENINDFITKTFTKKKTLGDSDNDGDRDNSFLDKARNKKSKEKSIVPKGDIKEKAEKESFLDTLLSWLKNPLVLAGLAGTLAYVFKDELEKYLEEKLGHVWQEFLDIPANIKAAFTPSIAKFTTTVDDFIRGTVSFGEKSIGFVDDFGKKSIGLIDDLVGWGKNLTTNIAETIGKAFPDFTKSIGNVWESTISKFSTAFSWLGDGVGNFIKMMKDSPIGKMVGSVGSWVSNAWGGAKALTASAAESTIGKAAIGLAKGVGKTALKTMKSVPGLNAIVYTYSGYKDWTAATEAFERGEITEEELSSLHKRAVAANVGGAVGSSLGTIGGAFVGSAAGPVGTFVGGAAGGMAGGAIGESIGGRLIGSTMTLDEIRKAKLGNTPSKKVEESNVIPSTTQSSYTPITSNEYRYRSNNNTIASDDGSHRPYNNIHRVSNRTSNPVINTSTVYKPTVMNTTPIRGKVNTDGSYNGNADYVVNRQNSGSYAGSTYGGNITPIRRNENQTNSSYKTLVQRNKELSNDDDVISSVTNNHRTGGYGSMNNLTRGKQSSLITRDHKSASKIDLMRYVQYGFSSRNSNHLEAIFDLEDHLKNAVSFGLFKTYVNESNLDIKYMMSLFNLNSNNPDHQVLFVDWFIKRFKPVYLKHAEACRKLTGKTDFTSLSGLSNEKLSKYINETRFSNGPYDYSRLPILSNKIKATNINDVEIAIDNIIKDNVKEETSLSETKGSTTRPKSAITGLELSNISNKDNVNSLKSYTKSTTVSADKKSKANTKASAEGIPENKPIRISAIDTIRFKAYGLVSLEEAKVKSLQFLENAIFKDIKYGADNSTTWEGDPTKVLEDSMGYFGLRSNSDEKATAWINWFNNRFLPVLTKYMSSIYSITGKQNILDISRVIKPNDQLVIAKAITGLPFWSDTNTPWPNYSININSDSIEANINFLDKSSKEQTLLEQTSNAKKVNSNNSASKDNNSSSNVNTRNTSGSRVHSETGSDGSLVDMSKGDSLVANDLRTIRTKSGKTALVKAEYAEAFQGFINELESTGYNINTLDGYADRTIKTTSGADTGKKSIHAYGGAIDINRVNNPYTKNTLKTDLPPNVAEIAHKYGIGWGGNWGSSKDPMHFSIAKSEGGSVDVKKRSSGIPRSTRDNTLSNIAKPVVKPKVIKPQLTNWGTSAEDRRLSAASINADTNSSPVTKNQFKSFNSKVNKPATDTQTTNSNSSSGVYTGSPDKLNAGDYTARGSGSWASGGSKEVNDIINSVADEFKIDRSIMHSMAIVESNKNPSIVNKLGYSGLYQFGKPAWKDYGGGEPWSNVLNPLSNARAAARFIKANAARFAKQGIPVNPVNLYLAHQQGPAGFSGLWNDMTKGIKNKYAFQYKQNWPNKNYTGNAKDFYDGWTKKLNSKLGGNYATDAVGSGGVDASGNQVGAEDGGLFFLKALVGVGGEPDTKKVNEPVSKVSDSKVKSSKNSKNKKGINKNNDPIRGNSNAMVSKPNSRDIIVNGKTYSDGNNNVYSTADGRIHFATPEDINEYNLAIKNQSAIGIGNKQSKQVTDAIKKTNKVVNRSTKVSKENSSDSNYTPTSISKAISLNKTNGSDDNIKVDSIVNGGYSGKQNPVLPTQVHDPIRHNSQVNNSNVISTNQHQYSAMSNTDNLLYESLEIERQMLNVMISLHNVVSKGIKIHPEAIRTNRNNDVKDNNEVIDNTQSQEALKGPELSSYQSPKAMVHMRRNVV